MYISELYDKLKNDEVVLYGNVDEIKENITKYQGVLNIKYIITDFQEEVTFQKYKEWGLKTYLFDDICVGDELIIICSKDRFDLLQKRLMHSGKKAYENYISQDLVEMLVYNKKLMVCMGTHLIQQVSNVLRKIPEMAGKYSIVFYSEDTMMKPYINRLPEYHHICGFCDVYIRSSCEKAMFDKKIYHERNMKSGCEVITIADYCFAGYFPQVDSNRNKLSDYLFREHDRLEMSYETLAFSRADRELVKRCEDKEDKKQILMQLLDDTLFSKEYVTKYFAEELNRFKQLEADDDIKLGDFISQNYKKCLCRNLNEWNEPIITYVTEQLLIRLGVKNVEVKRVMVQESVEKESGSEIFMYPSVMKGLKISEQPLKKYKVCTYYKTRYMTLEDYVEFLIDYIGKAKELIDFAGMNNMVQ